MTDVNLKHTDYNINESLVYSHDSFKFTFVFDGYASLKLVYLCSNM